jgi:hypothetical protein
MKYVDVVRKQIDNIFAAAIVENGTKLLPHYYGDKDGKTGWYGYHKGEFYETGALGNLSEATIELYLWSQNPADAQRVLPNPSDRRNVQGWIEFLQGRRPDYPVEAMKAETQQAARAAERIRTQKSGGYGPSPVAFESLANLTLGTATLYGSGDVVRSQVRYFDPERGRAGLPQDVAALVETITPSGITLTLINTSAATPRRVMIQGGSYGEHQVISVTKDGGNAVAVNAPVFEARLAPGAGERLTLNLKRYSNDPTLSFPWARKN